MQASKLSRMYGCVIVLILLVAGGAVAWLDGSDPGVLATVRELIAGREYARAVAAIESRLAAGAADAEQEKLRFLLGHARLMMKDYDGARAAFARFLEAHPASDLRHKAVWKGAAADLGQQRFESAAGTYREEVLRLISPARKGEISDIYRRFAEEVLKKDPPQWKAARAFYDLAADLGLTAAQRQVLLRKAADTAVALKDHADAERRWSKLRAEFGDGPEGLHLYGLAAACLMQGKRALARRYFEDYIRRFERGVKAPQAMLGLAHTYGLPKPADRDRLERGCTWLRRFLERFPGDPAGAQAAFEIGESYFALKLYDDAAAAYGDFLKRFEESQHDLAGRARVAIGEGRAQQGRYDDAIAAWRVFLSAHPFHELWAGVQKKIVDAQHSKAMAAVAAEEREKARGLIREFLERHPLDKRNPELMYTLGLLSFQEKKYTQARTAWERLATKYPKSNAASHGLFEMGKVFESELFDFDKAIETYKRCSFGAHKRQAAARLAALKRKSLQVHTQGVFRESQEARVTVRSRNIEELRVRIYPLQLEHYFRARAGRGIEDLDIEVIEPLRTFSSKVKDYREYRESEREIALGVQGPGAWVVKLDDGEREATTLVLRSDLALLVKSTRHDLIALVQDRGTLEAVPGAKVVVSDGARVLFEGKSGSDGVFYRRNASLKDAKRVYVLASHGGHLATSGLSLQGLGHRAGLVARTHVGFDRPAYRPGEEVGARAIVREVRHGRLTYSPGEEYRLKLFDPSSALLLERSAKLSEYGTLAATFGLPDSAALGGYQVVVEDSEGKVRGRAGFQVQQYKLERFRLELKPEAPVVYRGEKIAGLVRASYFYGAPAADRAVRVELRGVGLQEGRTDEKGEYHFSFETEDLSGRQRLALMAWLSEDNVGASAAVMVSTTGLQLGISTVRDVVLAGESLDVELTARDMLGKPAAAGGLLRVFELKKERGALTEVQANQHEVALAKAAGKGIQRVRFPSGGWYRLRFEARDRFGNLITAQKDLFASGEEDAIKLRIFADRDHLEAGTAEKVRLHSRLDEVLALITREGDGFLSYEVRRLPRGETPYELAVGEDLAPNFALAVTAWSGEKLYEARHDFHVDRALRVVIEPEAAELSPGAAAAARVKVLDAAGKPVAAEVAVAVVDEALLSLFPGREGEFSHFFESGMRETTSRAAASGSFRYAARTRPIVKALANRDRGGEPAAGGRQPQRGITRGFWRDVPAAAQAGTNAITGGQVVAGQSLRISSLTQGGIATGRDVRARQESYFARPQQEQAQQTDEQIELFEQTVQVDLRGLGYLSAGEALNREAFALSRGARKRVDFRRSAYWNPALIVPPEGASIRFEMPDSTTAWKISGRGVTKGSGLGEGSASVVSRLPIEAWLKLPQAMLAGDEVEVRGIVRNQSGSAREVSARLSASGSLSAAAQSTRRLLQDGEELEIDLRVSAAGAGAGKVRLEVGGGAQGDVIEREIPVRPWSTVLFDGLAGVARDSHKVWFELPAGREYQSRRLSVSILPPLDEELLALADRGGDANFRRAQCPLIVDTLGRTITRGLTTLELEAWLRGRGAMNPERAHQLFSLLEAAVARVVQAQGADGGFNWVGLRANRRIEKVASDSLTSARALELLVRARARGVKVAEKVLKKAVDFVQTRYRRAPLDRYDLKARLVNALCWAGEAEFSYLNRLARARGSLDDTSLGLLAEAFEVVGRRGELADLAAELKRRARRDSAGAHWGGDGSTKALEDAVEASGLAIKALVAVAPRDILVREGARWLRSRAAGFGSAKGTAAAVKALVALGRDARAQQRDFSIAVSVNGRAIGSVRSRALSGGVDLDVPSDLIRARNEIAFAFEGSGEYRWRVRFEGTVAGVPERGSQQAFQVKRSLRPAPLRFGKRAIPAGFTTVVKPEEIWTHSAEHLLPGAAATVYLNFTKSRGEDRRLDYLVLEESIPAGATVAPGSVQGNFSHFVQGGGSLLFFFPPGTSAGAAHFDLLGYLPGESRMLPARLWPYHHPELMSRGKPGKLGVLRAGEKNPDVRRMTPDELYNLGKARYESGEHAAALGDLERFLADWTPREKYHREAARMAFYIALKLEDSKRVVRYFEILKERYPALVVAFDKMIAVGDSYRAMKEYERAWQVYRAVAEASFLKDLGVAGTLDAQKEFLGSVDFVRRLVREYPDLPIVASSAANLGQLVYGRSGAKVVDRAGRILDRRELLKFAAELGEDFLVEYPENPLCDEVTFGIANARLEREEYDLAIATSQAGGARYPRSPLLDDYLYIQGYADFALGRYKPALSVLQRVSEDLFPDGRGGRAPGDHRDLAVYMIGQIYHARGEVPRAIEAYSKVVEKFLDAREAVETFERRELALPEVVDFAPGDKVELEISSRNVERAQLRVYRVDLMRLYLIERNLDRVTDIELSGIAPYLERELALGSSADFAEKKTRIALPLEEAGAYLMVARAGALNAAGMVLKTDLELEVTEDVASGRVRVNVKSRGGSRVARAEVQVIGSGSAEFKGGHTDLRGVFLAEDIVGRETVMVRAGKRVAYHRGKVELQPGRMQRRAQNKQQERRKSFKDAATERLFESNFSIQNKGQQKLESLFRNRQAGVEVQRAKK